MRYFVIAIGVSLMGAHPALAQGKDWSSAGTYHQQIHVKKAHDLNNAKQASKINGAKVKKGTPSGASSGNSSTSSGATASGPHSHPLHGAGSKDWH